MTSDSKGVMYIWLLPGFQKGNDTIRCIVKWVNKHSMEIDIPISAVDVFYCDITQEFLLMIGDEKGDVKIQDLSIILRKYDLKAVDITKDENGENQNNRMGKKCLPLERQIEIELSDEMKEEMARKSDQEGELKPGEIKQIHAWHAHKDIIKAICYISMTDEPMVFTAGMDRMAYIWDLKENEKG